MLKLYHLDRSPFGWKVRLVMAEKNIPYESIVPTNKNDDPEFAKLNPFRLTPVLQLEDGRTIYESSVINEYLDEVFPDPRMLPEGPYERARIRILEDTSDQYLYAAVRGLRDALFIYEPPLLVPRPGVSPSDAAVVEARKRIEEQLGTFEEALGHGPWFGGEDFSVADAALVPPIVGSLETLGVLPDAKRFPRLAAWRDRVVVRPSFAASKPKEPPRIKR